MVDDAENRGGTKLEGGVPREHLKATVKVRKRRKIVVLDDDDTENGVRI